MSGDTRAREIREERNDLIIAATALATGRAVVTRDAHGFADLPGVQVRLVA